MASIILIACAKVSAPPGGPVDKTGASILESFPAVNSTNVPRNDRVLMTFSEAVVKKTAESSVFVSPRPDGELDFDWNSKTLEIIMPDSFAENTTYIISIGANVSDLRNNKMDASYQFAFSTGEYINKGIISGQVEDFGKPAVGATVALFDINENELLPNFDSLFPIYMTQSGKDGSFKLEYLPDGPFFLLAFSDINQGHTFDFKRESFGIADRSIIIDQKKPITDINIPLITQDTGSYQIVSVTPNPDNLFRIKLSNGIIPKLFENIMPHTKLIRFDEKGNDTLLPLAFMESGNTPLKNYHLYFDDPDSGRYILQIDSISQIMENDSISNIRSPEFVFAPVDDQTSPEIVFFSHKDRIVFPSDNDPQLKFSEPIQFSDTTQLPLILLDSDTLAYDIEISKVNPLVYQLLIPDMIAGQKYRLSLNGPEIADRVGNSLSDSIVDFNFSTYDDDSLGSVSGTIIIDSSFEVSAPAYLNFAKYPQMETFELEAGRSAFTHVLPPGKYQLRGFLDINNNGQRDLGSLYPFKRSETWVIYPDTIRVRPRFETAGIKLIFK